MAEAAHSADYERAYRLIKHVPYQDSVTGRWHVMITCVIPETFDTEGDADAWAMSWPRHSDGDESHE